MLMYVSVAFLFFLGFQGFCKHWDKSGGRILASETTIWITESWYGESAEKHQVSLLLIIRYYKHQVDALQLSFWFVANCPGDRTVVGTWLVISICMLCLASVHWIFAKSNLGRWQVRMMWVDGVPKIVVFFPGSLHWQWGKAQHVQYCKSTDWSFQSDYERYWFKYSFAGQLYLSILAWIF